MATSTVQLGRFNEWRSAVCEVFNRSACPELCPSTASATPKWTQLGQNGLASQATLGALETLADLAKRLRREALCISSPSSML